MRPGGLVRRPLNTLFRSSSCHLNTPSSSAAHRGSVLRPPVISSRPAPGSLLRGATKLGSSRQDDSSAPKPRGCPWARLPFLTRTGILTFVSGPAPLAAVPGTAGIGAANAAVAQLVPILAAELKPLRVNGVSPGVIDTPWWDAVPEEQKQAMFKDYAAKTPVGRVGRPEDVAQTIAFLIGNDFMTGHMLVCDGGLRF